MHSVTSVSGGKTSSYLAIHYPTDYYVFALVRIDADYCMPKDNSIVKYVSDKIGMDFIATGESDITLYAVRDLEQKLGREIIWVTGETFDDLCKRKKALPNLMQRFCTTELKMIPIGNWWLKNIAQTVIMNVGFRYDEKERADRFRTDIKLSVGKSKDGRNKWKEFEWRVGSFPLIDDKITHYPIYQWSKQSGIAFPSDSNCVGCFWKDYQQLRKNWDDEPLKMLWFSELEKKMRRKFKKEMNYEKVNKIGLQTDFFFGTGVGCQAGFCTD